MTATPWARLAELFEEASAVPAAGREAWLRERCGSDGPLCDELASLLAAADDAPAVLGRFEDPDGAGSAGGAPPGGERLGPYVLREEIGRGGMSRVFAAERVGDELRRRVAIKRLANRAVPSEEARSRFRAEGQVLAGLSHPHIAQVFDAGVDEAGDPYLVMELIEGRPITEHCAAAGLDIAASVRCFLDVCAAVEHAHRRFVVHRDLKPSNILVDREGRVKLLDFGIAKLLDPERQGFGPDHAPTRAGWVPLTVEYAAPEQLRGGEITTLTDVHGLGLVLYELLVGRRPFELRGRPASEVERVVCEQEPERPSTAVRCRAAHEAAAGGAPATPAVIPADLDAIVLRALEKDPARRYGSARELADDLRRFLRQQPVAARVPTLGYRVGKLLRRHRKAAAAVVFGLLAFATTVTAYTVRLRSERGHAEREARRSREVVDLLGEILWGADPRHGHRAADTVPDLLARALDGVRRLDSEPLVQAELLHFLALAHFGQGRVDEAAPLFEEALALRRAHAPPGDPSVAVSLNQVGWARLRQERFADAAEVFAEAAAVAETSGEAGAVERAHALRGLALARNGEGRRDQAEALLREATGILRAHLGPRHPFVADSLQNLAIVARERPDRQVSRAALREALAIRREAFGPSHPDVAQALVLLGSIAEDEGHTEEARRWLSDALAIQERTLGAEHPATRHTRAELASLGDPRGQVAVGPVIADPLPPR